MILCFSDGEWMVISGLPDIFTISGGNIDGHLSSSYTTSPHGLFLFLVCLFLTMLHYCIFLPLSILKAMSVTLCLSPSSTTGYLALMMVCTI